jgi:hypothetical protein
VTATKTAARKTGGDNASSNGASTDVSTQTVYLTADQAEAHAIEDIQYDDVPAFGGTVKVRGLTAYESAMVQQASAKFSAQGSQGRVQMSLVDAETMKFVYGMVIPQVDHTQAMRLYQNSGPSFRSVLNKIDELSAQTPEAREAAAADFQEPQES